MIHEAWTRVLTIHRISNAALHWILRDESTRMSTLRAIYGCLKPGDSMGKWSSSLGVE